MSYWTQVNDIGYCRNQKHDERSGKLIGIANIELKRNELVHNYQKYTTEK